MLLVRALPLAAIVLAAFAPARVAAQRQGATALPPIEVGSRVRLIVPSVRREPFIGRVDSLDQGELVLDTLGTRRRLGFDTGPVLVDRFRLVRLRTSAVESVEISGGITRRRSTLRTMVIGALIGAAAFGAAGMPEVNPGISDFLKNVPVGLVVGGTIGAGVGYALGGERWLPAQPFR